MKNLKNYGIQELSKDEIIQTDGGGLLGSALVGFAILVIGNAIIWANRSKENADENSSNGGGVTSGASAGINIY